ncbi:MAG TPA: thermonuclease family protein [Solirubrobacter sp.]|nr:thermonuclease family protein [Solirubrobacter sp.]
MKRVSAFAKGGVLALVLGALVTAAAPATARAATCGDHPDQASAQRAKDTRDGDGDGIYCESLPCPCLAPDPRANSTGGDDQRGGSRRRAQRFNARITDVVDGDTVKVRAYGARRRHYTVRLIGIDTPETKRPGVPIECGGPQASSNMYRLAFRRPRDRDGDGRFDDGSKGRRVVLRTDPTQDTFDRYGRLLAYVRTRAGVSLQKRQLRAGLAEVYVYLGNPFRQVRAFRRAERSARRGDRGVWDRCDGDFHRS